MKFKQVSLSELEQPCGRPGCGHQGAVHTGGAKNWGWPIYDETWSTATGWRQAPGCDCAGRLPVARSGREAA